MRKILIVLLLITIHSMGKSSQKSEIPLTQEERFEMLFGKTMLHLRTVVKSRPARVARNTRVPELHMAPMVEEKQELVSRNRMAYHRNARTARKVCSQQRRHSLYITFNY